jgi:tRNA nucleotidyltransferase (CCA-adding enzyme)
LRTLAIGGDDLMALGIPKGKQIGELLYTLLDEVIEERLPNEKNALLQAAKERIE